MVGVDVSGVTDADQGGLISSVVHPARKTVGCLFCEFCFRKSSVTLASSQECDLRIIYRNTVILAVLAGGRPDRLEFCSQDDRKPSTGGTPNATKI